MALQLVGREVAATAARVLTDVPEDVRQLHGDTERAGAPDHGCRIGALTHAEHGAGQLPHAPGHTLAVGLQGLPGRVTGLEDVPGDPVKELLEGGRGDAEAPDGPGQLPEERVAGGSLHCRQDLTAEQGQSVGRLVPGPKVDDVVGGAARGVDGAGGAAPRGGKEVTRQGKGPGVVPDDCPAGVRVRPFLIRAPGHGAHRAA